VLLGRNAVARLDYVVIPSATDLKLIGVVTDALGGEGLMHIPITVTPPADLKTAGLCAYFHRVQAASQQLMQQEAFDQANNALMSLFRMDSSVELNEASVSECRDEMISAVFDVSGRMLDGSHVCRTGAVEMALQNGELLQEFMVQTRAPPLSKERLEAGKQGIIQMVIGCTSSGEFSQRKAKRSAQRVFDLFNHELTRQATSIETKHQIELRRLLNTDCDDVRKSAADLQAMMRQLHEHMPHGQPLDAVGTVISMIVNENTVGAATDLTSDIKGFPFKVRFGAETIRGSSGTMVVLTGTSYHDDHLSGCVGSADNDVRLDSIITELSAEWSPRGEKHGSGTVQLAPGKTFTIFQKVSAPFTEHDASAYRCAFRGETGWDTNSVCSVVKYHTEHKQLECTCNAFGTFAVAVVKSDGDFTGDGDDGDGGGTSSDKFLLGLSLMMFIIICVSLCVLCVAVVALLLAKKKKKKKINKKKNDKNDDGRRASQRKNTKRKRSVSHELDSGDEYETERHIRYSSGQRPSERGYRQSTTRNHGQKVHDPREHRYEMNASGRRPSERDIRRSQSGRRRSQSNSNSDEPFLSSEYDVDESSSGAEQRKLMLKIKEDRRGRY